MFFESLQMQPRGVLSIVQILVSLTVKMAGKIIQTETYLFCIIANLTYQALECFFGLGDCFLRMHISKWQTLLKSKIYSQLIRNRINKTRSQGTEIWHQMT